MLLYVQYRKHQLERNSVPCEGHFTHGKKPTRFFRTKGFIRNFDGFFVKTEGFLPKLYKIFGSEMPLGAMLVSVPSSFTPSGRQLSRGVSLLKNLV